MLRGRVVGEVITLKRQSLSIRAISRLAGRDRKKQCTTVRRSAGTWQNRTPVKANAGSYKTLPKRRSIYRSIKDSLRPFSMIWSAIRVL